jgi:hypothetical protein
MSAVHPAARARVPVTRILARDPAARDLTMFVGMWYVVMGAIYLAFPHGADTAMRVVFGAITALITLACGGVVLHQVSFVRRLLAEGASVEGRVDRLGDNEGFGYAEVEYEHAGRPYRARIPTAGMPGGYQPEQRVELLVDPRKPSRAIDPRRYTDPPDPRRRGAR